MRANNVRTDTRESGKPILTPLWMACASELRHRAEDLEDRVCGGEEVRP